eukprot:COSAG02_NODE_8296_length_2628_cov_2.115856_3_plen_96_part_00
MNDQISANMYSNNCTIFMINALTVSSLGNRFVTVWLLESHTTKKLVTCSRTGTRSFYLQNTHLSSMPGEHWIAKHRIHSKNDGGDGRQCDFETLS